jgi:8-oxo-dGTP pyrophosphatase MutT (NUDIX family)
VNHSPAVPEIIFSRDQFLDLVKEKIWAHPSNFHASWVNLKSPPDKNEHRFAAGVLMPLFSAESSSVQNHKQGEFKLMLIKRSSKVAQPGDLSFPGGMLDNFRDRLLSFIFRNLFLRTSNREIFHFLNKNDPVSARLISLFMAASLRESWEEVGLSPFRTELIGPLPTYNLTRFKRTIFPIAGFIKNYGTLRPNAEVEKIIEIPLSSFYRPDCLGSLRIATSADKNSPTADYPCLIHYDKDGEKEVLWGATFFITVEFLRIVLGYHLPEMKKGEIISRTLSSVYLSDKSRK